MFPIKLTLFRFNAVTSGHGEQVCGRETGRDDSGHGAAEHFADHRLGHAHQAHAAGAEKSWTFRN